MPGVPPVCDELEPVADQPRLMPTNGGRVGPAAIVKQKISGLKQG